VALLRGSEPPRINGLAWQLGISERQLGRRFRVAVGNGPKTLARVVRF
jgi:transcriptional regulator GlxA family with amidase domain